MEVLTILANGLVEWTTQHWFLTFLLLASFKGIHLHFGSSKKKEEEK